MKANSVLLGSVLSFGLIVSAAACKSKNNNGPTPVLLTGDMTGATSVAVTRWPSTSGQAFRAATLNSAAFSTLVKVDSAGSVHEVLNAQRPVFDVVVTSADVLVSGWFTDIIAATGGNVDCYLVAIPRQAAGTPVQCLTTNGLSVGMAREPGGQAGFSDLSSFTAWGTTALFAVAEPAVCPPNSNGCPGPVFSALQRWVHGSTETQTLIYFPTGSPTELYQPFIDTNQPGNACVIAAGHLPGLSGNGQTLCGALDGDNWADMNIQADVGTGFADADFFQVGDSLLFHANSGTVLHLDNLTQAPTATQQNFDIPRRRDLSLSLFNGRMAGLGNSGGLLVVDTAGQLWLNDTSEDWSLMIGDGNYGWFYGTSTLKRMDRATGVLGTANYLAQTGMLEVTDMSFSTNNRIRLDGTAADGQPVIVVIDPISGEISQTTENVPQFQQTIPLE